MIEQIFEKDAFKIISLFSISPGSRFTRTDIKDKTRLNNVPLDKALLRLQLSGIIKRNNNLYEINFENDNSKKIIDMASKQYKNFKELPFNVYMILIDIADHFSIIKGAEVYLFGSYSKLIYHEKSDIDIAIITQKVPDKHLITKLTTKLEKYYGKKIEIHEFERSSFYKNKKDPLVKDILKNGTRLI